MVAARQHLVPCVLLWALLLCGQQASGEVDVNVTVNNVNPEVPVVDFVQVVSQAYVVQQVNDSTAFTFTECPIGYYCESADGVPIPCPGGTYQPAIGAKNLSNCLPCPPGEYCPSASVTPLLCPVSTYRATAGADDPTDCLPCPGGYVCPDNQTSVPTPCPAGTFLPYTGGYNLTLECQACPAGRYCPDGTMTPVNCPAGTFNVLEGAGALSGCVPCTRGGYCINGSMAPHPCDAGTYMPDLGAEAAADCLACTTGHYCGVETSTPTGCPGGTYMPGVGASFVTECVTCTVSHFCPVGTTTPYECLAGSYHTGSGLASSGDCVLCEPGLYQNDTGTTGCRLCLEGAYQTGRGTPSAGACTSCPAGTYQTGLGMPALANCTLCAEGNYQDVPRSTHCTLCGVGTYQTGLGMPEEARCSECGSGTYQTGVGLTAVANCLLCPANTFQPLTRQVSQAVCQSCPPLTHSPNGSAIQVDCVCDLGYEGANGGPCTQCNSSVWCRSGTPNPCPAHSLVNGTGAWQITDCLCLPGYYGFALNPVPCALCQADYYCPGQAVNLTLACPYGEYSLPGANASSSCYCPGNASSGPGASSVWSCTCDPGFKPVSSGADPIVGWECTHCVAGEVCYNDTVTQCPVDSFSSTGVGNFMNCVCNPGFYQVESPTAALMCRQCEQGYYCPGGVNKSQCNALMTSNMQATNESACYCVDGYVGTGNQTCQDCVSPYYCTLGMQLTCPQYSASVDRSSVIQNCSCNTGYWGQNGGSCRACAPGTYKNFQGCVSCQNVVATDCAACPLGTASNDTARPSVCPSCVPGYYQDTVSLTSCKTCVAGKYLESSGGVSAGNCTNCPAGTYSTTVASGNLSLCLACPPGTYQPSTGSSTVLRDFTRECGPDGCFASIYPGVWSGQSWSTPDKAFDGKSDTQVHSSLDGGGWLQVDLGVRRNITSGAIIAYNGYINGFQIWVGDGASGGANGYQTGNTRCFAHTTQSVGDYLYFGFACSQTVTGRYGYIYNPNRFLVVSELYLYELQAGCLNCLAASYCPSTGMSSTVPCPAQTYMGGTRASVCTACADGSFSDVGETFCKALTCAANSVGTITQVVPSNVSVRISASTRLASPNTYALSKNYQLFFRLYLQFAAGTNNQLVTLITSGGTVFNLVHQSSGTCYITGGNIPGLGGSLSTTSLPQTWDSRRLVVDENTAWFMLNGAYTTQATAAKASRSTYASGAVIWASENGASAANYLMDVQLVTCKCKLGYYGDGDTCTACASGYVAFSIGMSACTICPLGYYCPNATTQTSCAGASAGSYCGPGQAAILPCAAGYYCPDYATKTPCPLGTYNPSTTQTDISACLTCPVGFYCASTGMTAPTACPVGTYRDATGGTVLANCTACSAGTYQNQTNSTVCTTCPDNSASFPGSSAMHQCVCTGDFVNYTLPGVYGFPCTLCPYTRYKNWIGDVNSPMSEVVLQCQDWQTCGNIINAYGIPVSRSGPTQLALASGGLNQWYVLNANTAGQCGFNYYVVNGPWGVPNAPWNPGERVNTVLQCQSQSVGGNSLLTTVTVRVGQTYSVGVQYATRECEAGEKARSFAVAWKPGTVSSQTAWQNIVYNPNICGGWTFLSGVFSPNVTQITIKLEGNNSISTDQTFFVDNLRLQLASETCSVCLPGYYCGGGASLLCPSNTYSRANASAVADCGVACVSGYYATDFAGQVITNCAPCPAGYSCLNYSSVIICPGNTYSAAGSTACTSCPASSTSPAGSGSIYNCSCNNGTYWSWSGGTGMCTSCGTSATAGKYSQLNATVCSNCPTMNGPGVNTVAGDVTVCKCSGGNVGQGAYYNGAGVLVLDCSSCSPGSYSQANSPNCTACPAGTYGAAVGLSVCATCLVGSYCAVGVTVGTTCPAGSYCPAGASAATACPAGTYNQLTGQGALANCLACAAGTYSTAVGAQAIGTCVTCPAGAYCVSGAPQTVNCSTGSYTLSGASVCSPCAAGSYNPSNGSSACTLCAANTFQPLTQRAACVTCPSNSTGPAGSTSACVCDPGFLYVANASLSSGYQCNLCLPGYYCANGAQTACAAGTYQPLGGAVNVSQCLACALSTYASSTNTTSCTACPTNTLTLQTGSSSSAQCVCVPGSAKNLATSVTGTPVYYSFDASGTMLTPTLGPSSLPGSISGSTLTYTSTGCKSGGGCLVSTANGGSPGPWRIASMLAGTGMTVSFWFKINPTDLCGSQYAVLINAYAGGFYFWNYDCTMASNTWCYNQDTTTLCTDADHTRTINGLANNTWQHLVLAQQLTGPWVLYVNGVSRATYNWAVALSGASSYGLPNAGVAAFNVKGTYDDLFVVNTVVTAAQAQLLYNGNYSAFFPSDVCALCSAGAYTNTSNSTGCLQCSAGTFTAAAGQTVCGACSTGSYQLSGGSTFCTVCPAGSYCPSATSVVQCPATTYSNASGQTVCSTCEPGTYQPGSNSTTCISCEPGSSCALGVSALCVAGTYSPSPGLSACLPCPLGDYCPAGASQPNLCPAGSEGTHLNSIVIGNCTACVPGSVTPSSGMSACVNCSSGQYQLNSSATMCYTCAMDSYCPSTTAVVKCPNGTGSVPASTSLSACVCPALSTWLPLTNCTCLDDYMRVENASALAGFQCDPCPLGQFCAGGLNYSCSAGSVLVNGECACPAGQKRNDGQCVACGYGYHSSLGMQTNCTACPSGSNTSGQTSPDVTACHCDLGLFGSPQGGLTCSPCRPGYFCPWNASAETACPSGTYQPLWQQIHSAACLVCPTGGYCPEPGANAHPTSCPNGTSSWQTRMVDDTMCEVCPAGTYCPAFSAEPTICPAGTFGAEPMGENASACAPCPAGQYCQAGVTEPTPCPAGRHLEREGGEALRDCDLCPEGSYSLAEGVGGPCPDCPGDLFCQTPLTQQACPEHTTSAPGSYTKLNCSCDGGYACSYHKVIQAVVTVNSTVNSFLQDEGGVQTAFINTLALAAHVDPSQVVINSVASADQSMRRLRRLLGLPSPEDERELPEGVHVTASIAGVNELRDPALHQHGGLEILEHSWEELHLVSARAWR